MRFFIFNFARSAFLYFILHRIWHSNFLKNAHWHTRYSIEAFTLIKAFSILNNAFTRRFNPGDIRHACLAFTLFIIQKTNL